MCFHLTLTVSSAAISEETRDFPIILMNSSQTNTVSDEHDCKRAHIRHIF